MTFVLRYSPAIREYIAAQTRDPHEVDEIVQEFLMKYLQSGGLSTASADRGRFRDYLKVAVRNSVRNYFRKKHSQQISEPPCTQQPAEDDPQVLSDAAWTQEWRKCILDKVWSVLEHHQRQCRDNLYYTALRLRVEFPDETSNSLAMRISSAVGKSISPAAFRKQLSRARKLFAEAVLDEVLQTVDSTRADIEEELIELGLLEYCRDVVRLRRSK